MPCCGKSLPEISVRNIFRKVRCISACCGSKIIIQDSDIDGGEIYSRAVLQSGKTRKLWCVDSIYRAVKNEGKHQISRNKMRTWLRKQDTYTLHKPVRYRFQRNRVIVGAIDEQWEANLVIMDLLEKYNNNYRYILTLIDVLSKYAWVEPIKANTGGNLVSAFEKILKKQRKPETFHSDKGTEFTNRKFQALLRLQNTFEC